MQKHHCSIHSNKSSPRGGVSITSLPSLEKKTSEPMRHVPIESIAREARRSRDACAGLLTTGQRSQSSTGRLHDLAKPIRSLPILGYRERKCNIKREGINPRFMTDEQTLREICSMRNCNHAASYFESGMFWCKYCYWLNSSSASKSAMKYLDVIGC